MNKIFLAIFVSLVALNSAFASSATWSSTPSSSAWFTETNWNPVGVPNGPADVALFYTSTITDIGASADREVNEIIFNPGANAFSILSSRVSSLTLSGAGITNYSQVVQNFVAGLSGPGSSPAIHFINNATAGSFTTFTNRGSSFAGVLSGFTQFEGNSTAGSGTFINEPGMPIEGGGFGAPGFTEFHSGTTAGSATFLNLGGVRSGFTHFFSGSTAGSATFTSDGGNQPGQTIFDDASAGNGTFYNNGAVSTNFSGRTIFNFSSTAGTGTFINNGGLNVFSAGGITIFSDNSTAAGATLIANNGQNTAQGGAIEFDDQSTGGTSRIELFGDGVLGISGHSSPGVTVGSIEGDGFIRLGGLNLTTGTNDLDTIFSGLIDDEGGPGGSISKVGSGTLTLSGANTYTGGTEIMLGRLLVSNSTGSGTGPGPVVVENGAILGGTGTIQLGSGAILTNNGTIAPGASAGQFNISGNIQLNYPSTLSFEIDVTTPATEYDVLNKSDAGALTLNGKLTVTLPNGFTPQQTDSFTIVETQAVLGGAFTNVKSGGRLNTTDGEGSFTVSYGGTSSVVLSNFGPVLPVSRAQNISTRANVQTGDDVAIGGFIITGNSAKKVIVRGLGPSLQNAGISNPLPNPTLELHGPNGLVVNNDDWEETQQTEIQDTGLAPGSDLESAIVATLQPGAYTAILAGNDNSTGIGLVEVFDLDPAADAKLGNLSTRSLVGTGDNVMIGGIIVGPGNADSAKILVRALGPALQSAGISNFLADPTLELRDGNGTLFAVNDNWKDIQQADLAATGLAPSNDAEPAILVTLAPGAWTAIVRGAADTSGVALVEAYYLP